MASFKKNAFLTLAAYMAVMALDKGAGFVVAFALRHNPGDKGALDLIGNLGFILMAFGNMGLATSLVYFLRRGRFPLSEVVESTVAAGASAGTALAALALGAVALASVLWPGSVTLPPLDLIVPALAVVPLLLCTSYLNSAQIAEGRIGGYNLVNLLPALLFLPVFLLFFLTGHDAVRGSIWARSLVTLLAFGAALLLARRMLRFRPRFHGAFLKAALGYGWRANVMSLLTVLGQRLDLYLVALLAPGGLKEKAAAAGVYSLSVTLAELVWHLPDSMRDVFFSRVAGQSAEEARAFTPVVSRNLLALALLSGLLVFFPGAWLADWIFPSFVGLTASMRILLPGSLAYVVAKILHFDLAGRGRINLGILCTGITVAVMIVLDFLWIPRFGAQGAAAASLVAYLASALASVLIYARVAGVAALDLLVPRRSDRAHYRAAWEGLKRRLAPVFRPGGLP